MNETSVSVVIPAYNAANTLGRAIDSVLNQTVPVHEIIVVDDGSSDRTNEVARRYGPAVNLIEQANSRTAAARNRGIEAASGAFIAFLDADDFWEPEKTERQLAVFAKHPNVAVVGGRFFSQHPAALTNHEPTALAAGAEATTVAAVGPEASAYGSGPEVSAYGSGPEAKFTLVVFTIDPSDAAEVKHS